MNRFKEDDIDILEVDVDFMGLFLSFVDWSFVELVFVVYGVV